MKLKLTQHNTDNIPYSNLCIREETHDISRLINSWVQRLLNTKHLVVINNPQTARSAIATPFLIIHTIVTFSLPHMKKEFSYNSWNVVPTVLVNGIHVISAPATYPAHSTQMNDIIPGSAQDTMPLGLYDNQSLANPAAMITLTKFCTPTRHLVFKVIHNTNQG